MFEKCLPRCGQYDPAHAAAHQRDAHFVLEGADLTAERRLCGVQPLLRGKRHAALLRDGDEVAKMP